MPYGTDPLMAFSTYPRGSLHPCLHLPTTSTAEEQRHHTRPRRHHPTLTTPCASAKGLPPAAGGTWEPHSAPCLQSHTAPQVMGTPAGTVLLDLGGRKEGHRHHQGAGPSSSMLLRCFRCGPTHQNLFHAQRRWVRGPSEGRKRRIGTGLQGGHCSEDGCTLTASSQGENEE